MALFLLDAAVKAVEIGSWVTPLITAGTAAILSYLGIRFEERRKELKEKKTVEDAVTNKDSVLKYNFDIHSKINEELNKIQGYTDCSRACLYHYHNGTRTHQGYCMNFISMVEEATDGVVSPIIDSFQAVPASTFRTILNKIDSSKEGFSLFIRNEGSEEENRIYNKFQTNMSYNFKVGVSVWEGVVSLSWININKYLTQAEISHVQQNIEKIADLQRKLIKPTK